MRHVNVYTSKPSKAVDLTGKYVKKIYPLKIRIKEGEKFRITDHILDNEIESFIVHLSENNDVNYNWDEM